MICNFLHSQDSSYAEKQYRRLKKTESAIKLGDKLASARNYLKLGDEALEQGDYKKSEIYYKKSLSLFTEKNNKNKIAEVSRKLAKVQEYLSKTSEALYNYQIAGKAAAKKEDIQRNSNDVQRVSARSIEDRKSSIYENIGLNTRANNKVELAQSYQQLADVQIEENQYDEAEVTLQNAYDIGKDEDVNQAQEINQKLTDVYLKNKKIDKAIDVKKKILEEDFVKSESKKNILELQNLAKIYEKTRNQNEAIKTLREAYNLAIEKGHTLAAKNSLDKLDTIYQKLGTPNAILPLYKNYLSQLPSVIKKDKSLINQKLLAEAESKVLLLEKEQQAQRNYINTQSTLNWVLIGSVVLLSTLLLALFLFFRKLRVRNKKIQLQALRREMNPHFIFNSLNSLNNYIANQNERESNQFLTRFSTLMRQVMKNSDTDFLPLEVELEMLENYLELEKKRFNEHFDYTLNVAEELLEKKIEVPGMLIQPFLENAIWHGLRYKEEKGILSIDIRKHKKQVLVTIEDNGIGIKESKKLKTKHQKQHNSRGLQNNNERISLLNKLYKKNIVCEVLDKENASGVKVSLKFNG